MVLNLDVRYALAIKSDVTLHAGRKKTILAVCMHYAGHTRSQELFPLKKCGEPGASKGIPGDAKCASQKSWETKIRKLGRGKV